MHEYKKGDQVEVLVNPYGAMLPHVKVGSRATVTSGGCHCISLDFPKCSVKAWLVQDAKGNSTIKPIGQSTRILAVPSGRVSRVSIPRSIVRRD